MSILDPNPHISILEDGPVKRQIAERAQRALETVALQKATLSEGQIERERFQYESNTLAEQNPLYAAARAASNFLVLPLEPHGDKPLVNLTTATREPRQLLAWWTEWPEANPGIRLGRVGGMFALRVEDTTAYVRLRELATVKCYNPDTEKGWNEYKEIGGAHVRLVAPSQPVLYRTRTGWEKAVNRVVDEERRQRQQRKPEAVILVYGYPSVMSGLDAFDYKNRVVMPGIRVLVLQPHLSFASVVVCAPCTGLMASAPS
jgi:hypothetical protein